MCVLIFGAEPFNHTIHKCCPHSFSKSHIQDIPAGHIVTYQSRIRQFSLVICCQSYSDSCVSNSHHIRNNSNLQTRTSRFCIVVIMVIVVYDDDNG